LLDDSLPAHVSALTTPYLTTPLFILLAGLYFVDDPAEILLYGSIAVGFTVVIPLSYAEHLRRAGTVESVHIFEQHARMAPLALTGASSVMGFAVLYLVGAPEGILRLGAILFMLAGALLAATWFLKVSGHVAGWTAGTTVLVVLYGPPMIFLYLVAVPIAWSRLRLEKHTWLEVIVGFAYGITIAGVFAVVVGIV
jgi:membrane-associated phospholipid phosphatase